VLQRLASGATLLDVGCFLGGDLRRLVFDGAPSANLYGVDIVSHWDVGYALYRDRGRFAAHFIEADILSISAVLHQWSREGQVAAAAKLVPLTRPGSLVLGYQIGNVTAKDVVNPVLKLRQWRHDPVSFAEMWERVGAETGTVWETEARLRSWEDMGWDPADHAWMEPGDRVIDFVVTRKS
jgi:hypothetical protein